MKRLISTAAIIGLMFSLNTPLVANADQYEIAQRTLSPFAQGSNALSTLQKDQVKLLVNGSPYAEKFICTGIRFNSDPAAVNIAVRQRARAACDYAKQLNPNLITWVQTKATSSKSFSGKVLLTAKTPSTPLAFDSYTSSLISSRAFASVAAEVAKRPLPENPNSEIVAGPNVSAAELKLERERLNNSIRFWSGTFKEPFTAYLYTGKDADWMIKQLKDEGNTAWNSLVKNDYWRSTGECTQSAAYVVPGNQYLIHCVAQDASQIRYSPIFAHEYAHLPLMTRAQNQAAGVYSELPVWLNEGAAQFFSIALTNQAKDPNSKYWHDTHLNGSRELVKLRTRAQSQRLVTLLPTITEAETVELLTQLEDASALTSSVPYSIGTWATEVLVAVKGADKYIEFLEAMNSTTDWKAAFEKTFEISVTDFYKSLTPYLQWIAKTYKD